MATIREEIVSIIGPKRSTTGEGNGVKSFTPQMWLVNDTDIFQIKPLLIDNDFTDLFYNVTTKEYLVWDSKFNFFKPLNGTTEMIFSGLIDVVFYQDDFVEMRWNAADDQPQFRVKGNIGWVDASFLIVRGGGQVLRRVSDDVLFHGSLGVWSAWQYWNTGGTLNTQNALDLWGANGKYSISKESAVAVGEVNFPSYFIELMKGDATRITISVKRILKK